MIHGTIRLTDLQADLLDTLINGPRRLWTVAEIAEDVGATFRPTQNRLVSLERRGYVTQGPKAKGEGRNGGTQWRATKEGREVFQNTTTIGQYPTRSKA